MPDMPEGFRRCFDIPAAAAAPTAGVDDEEADALDLIQRWRDVMISSFTVILSGEKSAFMDFNFLPVWLEGMSSLDVTDDRAVQHAALHRFNHRCWHSHSGWQAPLPVQP